MADESNELLREIRDLLSEAKTRESAWIEENRVWMADLRSMHLQATQNGRSVRNMTAFSIAVLIVVAAWAIFESLR